MIASKIQSIVAVPSVVQASAQLRPLIEEKVLDYLGLEIVNLEDYTDLSIPDNYPRYQLYRHGRTFGTIYVSGERYHTRLIHNLVGYASLYEVATCWIPTERLHQIEREIETEIVKQQSLLPDYF